MSTKSGSCVATKIDADKLLEKFNVKPPPFNVEERELVIESWAAVEQHIAQVYILLYDLAQVYNLFNDIAQVSHRQFCTQVSNIFFDKAKYLKVSSDSQ